MNEVKNFEKAIKLFLKWTILSIIIGTVVGILGGLFYKAIEYVTNFRSGNTSIIYLLPFAGLLIVALYKALNYENGNMDLVIDSTRSKKEVSIKLTPLITLSTIISHLFGASVGREGAALQLGASIGNSCSKIIKLSEEDKRIMILAGMSAGFSALFGTPLAATIFPLAFPTVGIFNFTALIPCLFSALIANQISLAMGSTPEVFNISNIPDFTLLTSVKVIILALMCACVSIVFSNALHKGSKTLKKYIPNDYLRIFLGGCVIVLLTLFVGTSYLGSGANLIENAIEGNSLPTDFIFKLIFTIICVCVGFKGGEIVPSLAIGATFGAFTSIFLDLPVSFSAACGMIALFCSVTNSPFTSLFLAIEMFGLEGLALYFIVIAVSYLLSGYSGLYTHQNFGFSKYELGKEPHIKIDS